jgi:hypothetical protein
VCFKRGASWPWSFGMARSTTLCDKVCQWFATGRWFSSYSPVSSINKTDRHNMTEILLNTIKPNQANQNILIHFTCYWSVFISSVIKYIGCITNKYESILWIDRNVEEWDTICYHICSLLRADVSYTRNRLLLRKLLHTIYNVYCILSSMLKCVGV